MYKNGIKFIEFSATLPLNMHLFDMNKYFEIEILLGLDC
jgi:hypothetical protein